MNPFAVRLALLAGILSSSLACAQSPAPRWSVGLGLVSTNSPYRGEGSRIRAFPFLGWEGERAYLRGLDLGVRLLERGPWALDAALSARLDGFDAGDLDVPRLTAAGVDRDRLEDRSDGIDAALTARWHSETLELQAQARHDVAGASEGSELRLRTSWPLRVGSWRWTPYVQASWRSASLADYYHGVEATERSTGMAAYRPGSTWVPEIGLGLNRGFRSGWFVLANLRYGHLPDALADSPLLEAAAETGLFLAIGRGF